jgi:L-threonylcarbamoyladenylate synthase
VTDDDLARALAALARGCVVAAATETFFGLLADARQPNAIDRILALKGRDASKGISLLLPSRHAWEALVVDVQPAARDLAAAFWPGPLTIALVARPELDPRLLVDGTVAVRWAGGSDAARITKAFGAPLTATSANLSGQPACTDEREVARALAAAPGFADLLLVPGRAPGGTPSTLVVVGDAGIRVVRVGQVSREQLAKVVPGAALR